VIKDSISRRKVDGLLMANDGRGKFKKHQGYGREWNPDEFPIVLIIGPVHTIIGGLWEALKVIRERGWTQPTTW
jgi:hypothetical protein